MDQHEIGDRWGDAQADIRQRLTDLRQPGVILVDRRGNEGLVADRRGTGCDCRRVEIEGTADAVQCLHHVARRVHPADAQTRKAVDLRKGSGHHHIAVGRNEFQSRLVVVAPDIFRIGRIEHQQDAGGQARMQTPDLLDGDIGTGRICRIGDEDDLRPLGHGRKYRIDIDALLPLLDRDGCPAGRGDLDFVDEKSVFGDDPLVAGAEIGMAEKTEQFVRPVAAKDVGGVQPVNRRDRFLERIRLTVRVAFEIESRLLESLDRARARAERRFVRRQLVNLGNAGRMFLARHIGGDVQDAGTRRRAFQGKIHRTSFHGKNAVQPIPGTVIFVECDVTAAGAGASNGVTGSRLRPTALSLLDCACWARPAEPAPGRRRGARRVRPPAGPDKAASAPRR